MKEWNYKRYNNLDNRRNSIEKFKRTVAYVYENGVRDSVKKIIIMKKQVGAYRKNTM